jgi:hypothetical protein
MDLREADYLETFLRQSSGHLQRLSIDAAAKNAFSQTQGFGSVWFDGYEAWTIAGIDFGMTQLVDGSGAFTQLFKGNLYD